MLFSNDHEALSIVEMQPAQAVGMACRRPNMPGVDRSRPPAANTVKVGRVVVNPHLDRHESAATKAAREYADLQRRIARAKAQLSQLQRDLEDARSHLGGIQTVQLLKTNEELGKVAYHGTDPVGELGPEQPELEPQHSGVLPRHRLMNEQERSQAQLRDAGEANTHLVLAALSAQEMRFAAEQAQQRLTQLMAVIAHELRNPIAPIRTAAALLGRVRSEELPRLQAIIERQVDRVLSLINDLLDVSRIDAGKLRVECEVVGIASVVAEAVDACRPAIDTRQQHLDIDLPSDSPIVNGDPRRLVQIVSNLLDNASKYTPVGGQIRLYVAVEKGAVMISLCDEGIGITAEALPHIFEPFIQDPRAVGFNGAGLGIGLSVVRALLQAHGGTVVARSAGVGQGSQFVVTLPVAAGSALP